MKKLIKKLKSNCNDCLYSKIKGSYLVCKFRTTPLKPDGYCEMFEKRKKMNNIVLLGNLTKDIEFKYINGLQISKSSIAVNNRRQKKPKPLFVDIVFFGKLTEISNQYLQKGDKVCIQGRLALSTYQDKNGNSRKHYEVEVENLEMLNCKNSYRNTETNVWDNYKISEKIDINEEEIPF